jgi:hypothetical protein
MSPDPTSAPPSQSQALDAAASDADANAGSGNVGEPVQSCHGGAPPAQPSSSGNPSSSPSSCSSPSSSPSSVSSGGSSSTSSRGSSSASSSSSSSGPPTIRIHLYNVNLEPIVGATYNLVVGGRTYNGKSDSHGIVSQAVSSSATSATLTLDAGTFHLIIGSFMTVTTKTP